MKKIFHVAFLACLTFSASLSPAPAWTNDLRITSITRVEDCTTLTWRSHPGEFYTVLWADELRGLNTFWRVAEVNVPSGGTNTTWTEGACSESMMAAGGGTAPPPLTKEQIEAFMEKMKGYEVPDYVYPPGHPKAAKEQKSTLTTQGGGGAMSLLGGGPHQWRDPLLSCDTDGGGGVCRFLGPGFHQSAVQFDQHHRCFCRVARFDAAQPGSSTFSVEMA